MGTSGCGKSSVAAACQKILHCELIEGDELHPQANIDKMSKGKIKKWRVSIARIAKLSSMYVRARGEKC